jgi:RNase H-fold protein (predicted Holliday junction resolvase)
VIAIDPGRDKCGLAALDVDGRLLGRAVIPTAEIARNVAEAHRAAPQAAVVIGAGTGSRDVQARLVAETPDMAVTPFPEAHSTERALERWRDTVRPEGWRRLLPRCLRFPPGPLDDFAAWVIAEDYLRSRKT